MNETPNWWIFKGEGEPHNDIAKLPEPPPWRQKQGERKHTYIPDPKEIELVNAALYLRRPLLVTGKPGTGKSSLAEAVAHELGLGEVLRWPITTQTTLKDGLYRYDAIARLQDTSINKNSDENKISSNISGKLTIRKKNLNGGNTSPDIGKYLTLGPLGSAFVPSEKPRVLLIDEIDKSDIDLPNNLLHLFEENEFEIPELARLQKEEHEISLYGKTDKVKIKHGKVSCKHFPLVIMTSNGEREFPPAFLRRCLQLEIALPQHEKLAKIVESHLKLESEADREQVRSLIEAFLNKRDGKKSELATDQLLNAVYIVLHNIDPRQSKDQLLDALWRSLSV